VTDQKMFELLVADAPAPRPGHVATALAEGRRARRRRRLTATAMGVAGVAVAVTATALLAPAAVGQWNPTGAPPPPTLTSTSSAPATTGRARSAEAEAYAVAVTTLARAVRTSAPAGAKVFIKDATCANVVTPTDGGCDPEPLPDALRTELAEALAGYGPVEYVLDDSAVTDANLTVVDGGVLVTLGRIRIDGDRAEVPLAVTESGLNGQGLIYRMSRHGTTWQIDGTVGTQWIS
jgi:hypothetical protein